MQIDAPLIIAVAFVYLGLLFAIAYWADRRAEIGRSVIARPTVYALSLAVYCTAWTFYGSVGRAADNGLGCLPIYSERHEGLVAAIAFESVVKLVVFVAVGVFVSIQLLGGLDGRLTAAWSDPRAQTLLNPGIASFRDWFAISLLAGLAVICLPRQFQVRVVENSDERHIERAMNRKARRRFGRLRRLDLQTTVRTIAPKSIRTICRPENPRREQRRQAVPPCGGTMTRQRRYMQQAPARDIAGGNGFELFAFICGPIIVKHTQRCSIGTQARFSGPT